MLAVVQHNKDIFFIKFLDHPLDVLLETAMLESQSFEKLNVQSFNDLVHVFASSNIHIHNTVLKNVSKLNVTD
jgi:hypothetical protein